MECLESVASALVRPLHGILAADEGISTMSARLAAAGVKPTEDSRRAYREMLVTTPGLSDGVSGVILCDESLPERLGDGRPLAAALRDMGMLPGIKADKGTQPLAGAPGETVTEGLDGLLPRLRDCAGLGAAFATWRAVLRIGAGMPTPAAVRANAQALGRYAAACQEAGLVPVVEPEILMDGPHSLPQYATVTSLVLLEVFSELRDYGAELPGVVLTPNMVVPGGDAAPACAAEVAQATISALAGVPVTTAGIAFLSGGQRPERATENLAAMQRLPHIWPLTFSFGCALADPALAAWRGDPARWAAGQRALARRVAMNVAALDGRYTPELELDPA
jgi:fructose-bisphosphate aldolase class I